MELVRFATGGERPSGISPNRDRVIFRQLFDPETSNYTYLLADSTTDQALLIDPVLEQIDRAVPRSVSRVWAGARRRVRNLEQPRRSLGRSPT